MSSFLSALLDLLGAVLIISAFVLAYVVIVPTY
jgi:hypothetical protein